MPSTARILIVKLIQAALLGGGLYLQYNSMEIWNHETMMLSCAAFGGYLAVVAGMIFAAILQEPVQKKADILYNFMGACLFGVTGYFVITYFYADNSSTVNNLFDKVSTPMSDSTRKNGLAKGGACFVIAFAFLVDLVATLRE